MTSTTAKNALAHPPGAAGQSRQQALRDLAEWVEKGVSPPASSGYKIVDGKVVVPPDAGSVVNAEWDFEGKGVFSVVEPDIEKRFAKSRVSLKRSHVFSRLANIACSLATPGRQDSIRTCPKS